MTALQDWLPTTAFTPRAIRALVRAPLRLVLPDRPVEAGQAPRLLRPGVERC
ncbi:MULTISPECIES: hypothetical protein [Mycolicibacterium]|uniref:hypothetical protein n=1 Tax=Mycolicibacterium TaxID=1866885 RepID=UPI0013F4CC13|nr:MULTISPECIES: hypothetical protein [Mycolicibacterium]MCW1820384.1 hypothetical protein [Mycolicibacterium senegalense]QZH59005.1 hypothetical protein K1X22_22620 [Mycolicibacterium farcinogenes]